MSNENRTKTCSKCGEEKNIAAFAKNKQKGDEDGYLGICKICHNQYYRDYYSNRLNMEKHVKRVYKNKVSYRKVLQLYKESIGCQICGYKKCHAALEFHHLDRDGKSHNISKLNSRSVSKDRLAEEIKKCILVCSNCHREIESGITFAPDDIKPLDIFEDDRFLGK
jgi:transcription elongation factor Elf1